MWTVTTILTVPGFLIHLLVASALGYAIGFERQWTRHQAGTVTTMMVVVGSFAFTAFAFLLAEPGNADFARIPGQIITGIGFLGAGLIIKEGGTIRGLTTAATVWASSAVGILVCLDNLWFSVMVAAALVFLHLIFHPVSVLIEKNRRYTKTRYDQEEKMYKISVVCPEDHAEEVKDTILQIIKSEPNVLLHDLEEIDLEEDRSKIRAFITTKQNDDAITEGILTRLGQTSEHISRAGWKVVENRSES